MTRARLRQLLGELNRMYTASEEQVACFMAALTCGALRDAFVGLAHCAAATRGERCWS